MTKASKKINDLSKQFLLIIFYFLIVLLITSLFSPFITKNNYLNNNLIYILIDLITLIIFLFIFRQRIIPQFTDFKKNGKKYLRDCYPYYIIGLIIMIVSNTIIGSYITMPTNEAVNRELINIYPYYAVFSMVILSPIIEELLTRELLKDTFKHQIIYILLSGLIFGSLHMLVLLQTGNLIQLLYIIPYGALGCALAKIYAKSNNIWTNIFFHSLHNFICITIILGAAL